jgi:hypothetical protein
VSQLTLLLLSLLLRDSLPCSTLPASCSDPPCPGAASDAADDETRMSLLLLLVVVHCSGSGAASAAFAGASAAAAAASAAASGRPGGGLGMRAQDSSQTTALWAPARRAASAGCTSCHASCVSLACAGSASARVSVRSTWHSRQAARALRQRSQPLTSSAASTAEAVDSAASYSSSCWRLANALRVRWMG